MDDIGKAIIMAGQILMFVFAATISIYLYNILTESIDSIMLASNYSNRGDAIVDAEMLDTTRTATKPEIIMAILDLKSKYEKTGDETYTVEVGTDTYKYVATEDAISINGVNMAFDTVNLRANLNSINDTSYKISYNEIGKALIYTEK